MKPNNFWLYHPRYWLYWLIFSVLWLVSQLPYRLLLRLGRCLGYVLMRLAKRARRNTATNLKICYPDLSEQQRHQLLKDNFASVGIGIFELLMSWWATNDRLLPLAHLSGLDYIDKALAAGNGIIIAAPHFTSLKLALRMFSLYYPVAVMYNRQKHPWFGYLTQRALSKYYTQAIPRENARAMVKALKQNRIVCYTPDVDPGRKSIVFAPFFNTPAATVNAVTRLTKMTGSQVLFVSFYRREDGSGYDIAFKPSPTNFPAGDILQDATVINQELEKIIRCKPEQYIWQYKRFKTRPAGESDFYG